MCNRFLAHTGLVSAAAAAIAAVADEARSDALRRHKAGHYSEIPANDGMGMELFAQAAFGSNRARENYQTACLFIEPMDDPQTRQWPFANTPFPSRDELHHKLIQSRRERSAALVPVALRRMANRGDAGWLFDNDEMFVKMADYDGFFMTRLGRRTDQQLDGLAFSEPPRRIKAQLAIDPSPARGDEPPHLIPGLSSQPLPQHGGKGQAGLFGGDRIGSKRGCHLTPYD
jgi:hypothetical protein